MFRIVIAFLLTPPVVALPLLLYATTQARLDESAMILLVITAYLYAITLIVGLPGVLVYRHMRWNRWWQFVVVGLVVGAAMNGSGIVVGFTERPVNTLLHALPFIVLGVVSTLAFWLIGVYRNAWFMTAAAFEARVAANVAAAVPVVQRHAETLAVRTHEIAVPLWQRLRAALRSALAKWRQGERPPPVCGSIAIVLLALIALGYFGAAAANWGQLGHAALLVLAVLFFVAVLVGVTALCLGVAAIVRRERLPKAAAFVAAITGLTLLLVWRA